MFTRVVLIFIFGFASSLSTSFDLRGVVNGNRMAGVPLGMSLGIGEIDVEGICTEAGMACQNCTAAITCVPLPDGWLKVPREQCQEGFTCNGHLGACSKQPVPECNPKTQEYRHYCEQVGIFPDAFDCRKFHLCSPPDGMPDGLPANGRAATALCPRHYGYNPQTAQCSIKLTHGQCQSKPVPDCKQVGEVGVLPMSVNHYYLCLWKKGELVPQIFVCPHGWYFWGGFCRPQPNPEEDNSKSRPLTKYSNSAASNSIGSNSKSSESKSVEIIPSTTSAIKLKPTASMVDSFFSTEKTITYPADTFLADKFDLTNYESMDYTGQNNNEFVDSLENEWNF